MRTARSKALYDAVLRLSMLLAQRISTRIARSEALYRASSFLRSFLELLKILLLVLSHVGAFALIFWVSSNQLQLKVEWLYF